MRYLYFYIVFIIISGCSGTEVDGFSFSDLFSDTPSSPLKIKNNTGMDIMIFKNDLASGNVLGGIQKGATWGTRVITEGYYVVKAISKDEYLALGDGSLASAKVIDTALVYVDKDSWVTNVLENRMSNPAEWVQMINNTSKIVEVKGQNWYDTPLVILYPGENRKYYLDDPGGFGYRFCPTVVDVEMSGSTVKGFIRKNLSDSTSYVTPANDGTATFSISYAEAEARNMYAYLYVNNQSGTGIILYSGVIEKRTTINRAVVNDKMVASYEFSPTEGVGSDYTQLNFATATTNKFLLSTIHLTNGQKYYVNVFSDRIEYDVASF